MLQDTGIWMATGKDADGAPTGKRCYLLLRQANRHGLIAGASGTGKTVTFKVMAEAFSQAGVPVFMADVKGDISGLAQPGTDSENMQKRIAAFGIDNWQYQGCPVRFWDMLTGTGAPVRVSISDMGPTLLSQLLGLTEVQEGVLNVVFRVADDQGLLLVDLDDLRAMLNHVSEHAKEYEASYGRVASQSVGAILRSLLDIENQGGAEFFGEPAFEPQDLIAHDSNGQGYVNILNAMSVYGSPQVYSMFLLWILSSLFDALPEVGDPDKPVLVFFFDEAHLLFSGLTSELVQRIVQVVKLIRSKGVGVYFITQSPRDIPGDVLAQLSNRVQHGLRAYTPAEQKSVKAAAAAFRENPAFDTREVLQALGTGEALVSFLDEDGAPSVVENAKILPPQCLMAKADEQVIAAAIQQQTALMQKYGQAINPVSAHETLQERKEQAQRDAALEAQRQELEKELAELKKQRDKELEQQARAAQREAERAAKAAVKEAEKARRDREKAAQKAAERAQRQLGDMLVSFGRTAGKQILRGIFGNRKS